MILKSEFKRLICIFVVFAFSFAAYASSSPPQGFTCSDQTGLTAWNNFEKELLKKSIANGNAEYYFLVPDEILHKEIKEEEFCGYKNKMLLIGFYEPKDISKNIGRITMISFAKHKDAISYEYRLYRFEGDGIFRGNSAGGALSLLFNFEYGTETGMHPLASFNHMGFLGYKTYWAIVMVKLKDGKSFVYAQKMSPK